MVKKLTAAQCAPTELLEMYDWFEADAYWSDKGFDLGTAVSQLDKFRQSKRTPPAGFRDRSKQTITERNMENNRKARVILEQMERQRAGDGVFEAESVVIQ